MCEKGTKKTREKAQSIARVSEAKKSYERSLPQSTASAFSFYVTPSQPSESGQFAQVRAFFTVTHHLRLFTHFPLLALSVALSPWTTVQAADLFGHEKKLTRETD